MTVASTQNSVHHESSSEKSTNHEKDGNVYNLAQEANIHGIKRRTAMADCDSSNFVSHDQKVG